MKPNGRLGVVVGVVGALLGIVGHFVLFLSWYERGMAAESAEPGCEILLKYIMPALFDVGVLGGVLFAVSGYGFYSGKSWAFPLGVMAIVLALQGAWFINVPFMAAKLPPVYFVIFWPYLALFFLLMRGVGRVPWNRTLLGLLTGMTYVFCFMNGVASTSRIITVGTPIFAAVQRLHWLAMIGWGVVTVKLLLRPTEWMRVLGLVAGLLELAVGIPLAIVTAIDAGRFSMFAMAPIFSLALVVVFVVPTLWHRFTGDPRETSAAVQPA